jgi:hypothetical protein
MSSSPPKTYSYSEALLSSYPDEKLKQNLSKQSDIRDVIASILNIPNDKNWKIQDSIPDKNLYLVHYTDDADLNIYGKLRGLIVDTKTKIIVCRGRGHTPIVTTNNLELNEKQQLELTDENGKEYKLKNFVIERGYEATGIYRWKHNGTVYYSTNKTIDAFHSHWGKSKTFGQIYTELGGPNDNEIFNTETMYSPYVHEFLIVHPDLLNVTKLPIGVGFIVSLGIKMMWDPFNSPFENYNVERDSTIIYVKGTPQIPINTKVPIIHTPMAIDLETANLHLNYGFYKPQDFSQLDHRLTTGEFIIIYSLNELNQIDGIIKVQSTAYKWRSELRSQNPNLKYRLCELVTKSYSSPSDNLEDIYDVFLSQFPIMTPKGLVELDASIKTAPIVIYPQDKNYLEGKHLDILEKKEQRFYNIFLCLLSAVPLHLQENMLSLYTEFEEDRNNLIEWLKRLYREKFDTSTDEKFYRANNILTEASKQASFTLHNPNSEYGKGKTFYSLFSKNVYSFIMKERGDSLYKLIKLMHTIENESKNGKENNSTIKNVSIMDEINKNSSSSYSKIPYSKNYIKNGNIKKESILDEINKNKKI